ATGPWSSRTTPRSGDADGPCDRSDPARVARPRSSPATNPRAERMSGVAPAQLARVGVWLKRLAAVDHGPFAQHAADAHLAQEALVPRRHGAAADVLPRVLQQLNVVGDGEHAHQLLADHHGGAAVVQLRRLVQPTKQGRDRRRAELLEVAQGLL